MKIFQQIEHHTDLKLRVTGENLEELFKNAALALFKSIDPRTTPALATQPARQVQTNGADLEALMVNWLNELLALHAIEKEDYCEIKIHDLTENSLKAEVRGQPCHQDRYNVKAATYHCLEITKTKNGYQATILFEL